jgi:hypothetical protein
MRPGVKYLVRAILDKMRAGRRSGVHPRRRRTGLRSANRHNGLSDDRKFDHEQRGDQRAT